MAIFIPFFNTELPVQKVFEIEDTDFTYRVQHNSTFNYLTLTILDKDDNILYSNKLVYKNDVLISGRYLFPGIPNKIIPFDPKNKERVLTFETLDTPIKLYLI